MDYDTAVSVMFHVMPEDAPPPPTTAAPGPARRLRDAIEPVATHAAWARGPNEALAKQGLDFLTGYVWGRAAVLGEPPPVVVAAAFGVFEPNLIGAVYEMARAACGRAELLAARAEATITSLTGILEGADVAPAAAALRRAVEATDGTGRVLFCGLRSLEWPEDPVGQLWRACEAIREHRGESHLAASLAVGLDPVEMNVLSELWLGMPVGSHATTFGWPADAVEAASTRLQARGLTDQGRITTAGRRFRDEIEASTDTQQQDIVDALGGDFESTVAAVDTWSAACVAAGAYPPDPYKRAGG